MTQTHKPPLHTHTPTPHTPTPTQTHTPPNRCEMLPILLIKFSAILNFRCQILKRTQQYARDFFIEGEMQNEN